MKIAIFDYKKDIYEKLTEELSLLNHEIILYTNKNINTNFKTKSYKELNFDIDLVINFSLNKEILLQCEDKKILSLDLTNNFLNDNTIPVTIKEISKSEYDSLMILRIPDDFTTYITNLLFSLKEHSISKISIYNYSKSQTDEDQLCDDISDILCYDKKVNASNIPSNTDIVHLNIEFIKPYKLDTVVEKMANFNADKVSRDLSSNSGLNIWLKYKNNHTNLINNIKKIIQEIKID